jgi:hypothetical protein
MEREPPSVWGWWQISLKMLNTLANNPNAGWEVNTESHACYWDKRMLPDSTTRERSLSLKEADPQMCSGMVTGPWPGTGCRELGFLKG